MWFTVFMTYSGVYKFNLSIWEGEKQGMRAPDDEAIDDSSDNRKSDKLTKK